MVFLRPIVVRDASATEALSNNRYQQMMGVQNSSQPSISILLDAGGAAKLPPIKESPKPSGK
jgi:general secretion pathway protein D